VDSNCPVQGLDECSSEHCNLTLEFLNGGEFLEKLRDYQLIRKNSAM
jgi:hypothetical protein